MPAEASSAALLSLEVPEARTPEEGELRVLPGTHFQGSRPVKAAAALPVSEVHADTSGWDVPVTHSPSQAHLLGPMAGQSLCWRQSPSA